MRLAELSEHSGVSVATIKYYLRERLLHPGARVSATRAEYDEEHLRRLRLVRALVQVGKVPVATARDVLAAVDDQAHDQLARMTTAVAALPQALPPVPEGGDEAAATARRTAADIQRRAGWRVVESDPAHQALSLIHI